ncbi:MAG: hypothetical protein J0L56_09090 [Chitinophagales bacterium]|nr:hypothetical protein [Chitinophagales bacterium]
MAIPNKVLKPSFDAISELFSAGKFHLHTVFHLLDNHEIEVKKIESGFAVELDFQPFKGFSSTMLNDMNLEPPLSITQGARTYYIPERSLRFNSFGFPGDDNTMKISGELAAIASTQLENYDGKYLRLMIPVLKGHPKIGSIKRYWYDCDLKATEHALIKVYIHKHEYHFFIFRNKDSCYLVIDSTKPVQLADFRKVVVSISNGFGFLFGDLFMDEGILLSSANAQFDTIENIWFSTYRESIYSGYAVYTVNPYSIYNVTGQTREEVDRNVEEIRKWYEKILDFDDELFSKLCTKFYDSEPFSRAAIVVLQANTLALEIKGSAYSIAMEAITAVMIEENHLKIPKPISDDTVAKSLIKEFMDKVEEFFPKKDPATKDIYSILKTRISNLNKPTNADKLRKPFELFGYVLKDYEKEVIKHRDVFQHGGLPGDPESPDAVFQDVYYSCMVLHRMIVILVLKYIGFSGYIINYPQLHKHITAKDLSEDLLYKI